MVTHELVPQELKHNLDHFTTLSLSREVTVLQLKKAACRSQRTTVPPAHRELPRRAAICSQVIQAEAHCVGNLGMKIDGTLIKFSMVL